MPLRWEKKEHLRLEDSRHRSVRFHPVFHDANGSTILYQNISMICLCFNSLSGWYMLFPVSTCLSLTAWERFLFFVFDSLDKPILQNQPDNKKRGPNTWDDLESNKVHQLAHGTAYYTVPNDVVVSCKFWKDEAKNADLIGIHLGSTT